MSRSTAATVTFARGPSLAWARRWLSAWFPGWRSRPARQLRLRETLALGERRFLAVVEFEQQRFLIGGTGSSVALLSHLPDACRGDEDKDKDEDAGRK